MPEHPSQHRGLDGAALRIQEANGVHGASASAGPLPLSTQQPHEEEGIRRFEGASQGRAFVRLACEAV
jgi:hypothetical protein